jgi:hypothetical protein
MVMVIHVPDMREVASMCVHPHVAGPKQKGMQ